MTHEAMVGIIKETYEAEAFNTIDEAVAAYGEAPVYSLYRQKFVIASRGVFTSAYDKAIKDGSSHDEAVEIAKAKVAAWKPGQASPRTNKEDKAFSELLGLDDAAIARLEAKQGLPAGALLQIRNQLRDTAGWEEDEE